MDEYPEGLCHLKPLPINDFLQRVRTIQPFEAPKDRDMSKVSVEDNATKMFISQRKR